MMKSKMLQKWLGIGCLGGLLAISSAHAFPSASVKASGLGGACVSNPTDSLAQIYNPAATASTCQRFDIGATVQYWERDFVQINRSKAKRQWAIWPEGGFTTWINNNVALGLTVSTWDFLKTDNQAAIAGLGTSPVRWDYWVESVKGSIGWRFNSCNALGVSVDYYQSRLLVRGLETFAPGTNQRSDYSSGVGVTIGYLWKALPSLTIGASYSPKVRMKKYDRYSDLLATDRIDLPPVYRLAATFQPWCWIPLNWSTDLEFKQYDRVKSMSNTFNSNTLGSDAGPGWAWRNQWIIKTGLEYEIVDWFTARVGYRYESPLFKNNKFEGYLNAAMLRVVQHYATIGLTWEVVCGSELSAFGEYGFHQSQNGFVPASITAVPAGTGTRFKENNFAFGFSFGQQF